MNSLSQLYVRIFIRQYITKRFTPVPGYTMCVCLAICTCSSTFPSISDPTVTRLHMLTYGPCFLGWYMMIYDIYDIIYYEYNWWRMIRIDIEWCRRAFWGIDCPNLNFNICGWETLPKSVKLVWCYGQQLLTSFRLDRSNMIQQVLVWLAMSEICDWEVVQVTHAICWNILKHVETIPYDFLR